MQVQAVTGRAVSNLKKFNMIHTMQQCNIILLSSGLCANNTATYCLMFPH